MPTSRSNHIDILLERDLHAACVAAAKAVGCVPLTNTVVRKGKRATGLGKGSPDILLVVPAALRLASGVNEPAYLWFELKTKTGRRSPAQVKWHAEHSHLGMRIKTITSVTEMLAEITAVRFGRAA